jgi:hypothetical protein
MASDKTPEDFLTVCWLPRLSGVHPSAEVNFALPIDFWVVSSLLWHPDVLKIFLTMMHLRIFQRFHRVHCTLYLLQGFTNKKKMIRLSHCAMFVHRTWGQFNCEIETVSKQVPCHCSSPFWFLSFEKLKHYNQTLFSSQVTVTQVWSLSTMY